MSDSLAIAVLVFMIMVSVAILQLLHWIALKIFRKPKMGFRKWIKSWIAGPELFFGGILLLIFFHVTNPNVDFLVVLATLIQGLGIITFILKIIVYTIARVYRKFSKKPSMYRQLEYGPHSSAGATQPPLRYAGNTPDAANDPETI